MNLESVRRQTVRKLGIFLILFAVLIWAPVELYLKSADREFEARRNYYLGIFKEVGEEIRLAGARDFESGRIIGPGNPSERDIAIERTRPAVAYALAGSAALSTQKRPFEDFARNTLYLIRPLAILYGSLGGVLILASLLIRLPFEREHRQVEPL